MTSLRDGARALEPGALLAALLALWWVASHAGWANRAFLPTPEAVLQSLADGLNFAGPGRGELASFTGHTLRRMVTGWVLASMAGIALGSIIGLSKRARAWLQPMLEFMRPLPASAVLPLAIALFGLSDGAVLCVVVFGAIWPALLSTVQGVASVDPCLREVAAALQLRHRAFVLRIALPHALPDILAGMKLSLTASLILSVVGEMIASQPGLGQAILLAARAFRAGELFAGVVLLGALGLAGNALLALVQRRLLKWQSALLF